jgi:hypothetical protein
MCVCIVWISKAITLDTSLYVCACIYTHINIRCTNTHAHAHTYRHTHTHTQTHTRATETNKVLAGSKCFFLPGQTIHHHTVYGFITLPKPWTNNPAVKLNVALFLRRLIWPPVGCNHKSIHHSYQSSTYHNVVCTQSYEMYAFRRPQLYPTVSC